MKIKVLLFSTLFFCFSKIFSQDSLKIKEIDSLVNIITHSDFPTQRDSISQDHPELGLSLKTYLIAVTYGKELKKYVNKVSAIQQENGISKPIITATAFYYDQNSLIKVEEFAAQGEKEQHFVWYFSEDKCFYDTFQSDKADERATYLLALSYAALAKILNKHN